MPMCSSFYVISQFEVEDSFGYQPLISRCETICLYRSDVVLLLLQKLESKKSTKKEQPWRRRNSMRSRQVDASVSTKLGANAKLR
jgi:hypothetical protein